MQPYLQSYINAVAQRKTEFAELTARRAKRKFTMWQAQEPKFFTPPCVLYLPKDGQPYVQQEGAADRWGLTEMTPQALAGCRVEDECPRSAAETVALAITACMEEHCAAPGFESSEINEEELFSTRLPAPTWGDLLTANHAPPQVAAFFEQLKNDEAPGEARDWFNRYQYSLPYEPIDLYALDYWLIDTLARVLTDFKNQDLVGVPGYYLRDDFPTRSQNLDQAWNTRMAALNRMAFCFTEAANCRESIKEEKWRYREQMTLEGLELLKEHFLYLFD
jgi:hypothetical protein